MTYTIDTILQRGRLTGIALAAVGAVLALTPGEARAWSTADFTVDGTVWAVTDAATRTSINPIGVFGTVTAVANPSPITTTGFDGNNGDASFSLVCGPGGPLACTDYDGFGVSDDEVTGGTSPSQSLTVSFQNTVTVTDIYLLDFFTFNTASGDDLWTEIAEVTIGGNTKLFQATATNPDTTGGFHIDSAALIAAFGALPSTNQIVFTAPNLTACPTGTFCNDYAVAGISAVPIPAALPLLLTAVGGLGLIARRRAKTADA